MDLKTIFDAVERQGYEGAYIPQVIPVLGAAVSVATAIVSLCKMIFKALQAVYQRLKDDKPFFRPEDNKMDSVKFPMEDAGDLGLIFLDNVANIITLGFLNCYVVCSVSNLFVLKQLD